MHIEATPLRTTKVGVSVPGYIQILSVGLAGGLFLLWMAFQMFRTRIKLDDMQKQRSDNSVIAGLTLTAINPFFYLWWATIGAALLANARSFGGGGVIAMGVTHWVCDFSGFTFYPG